MLLTFNLKKSKIATFALGIILSSSTASVLHFRWDSFSIHLHQTNNSDLTYRKILFLGDSITEQGTRPRGFITKIGSVLTVDSQIMAKPGATTDEIEILLESFSTSFKPDLVITQSGINDYAEGQSQSDIAQSHEDLIAKISQHYPNASIWLLPVHPFKDILGGTPEENANAFKALLQGEQSAYRDAVLLNAAAALVVADKASDLKAGVEIARDSIDSGAARAKVEGLARITQGA